MGSAKDRTQLGLASCAATTDAVLRALSSAGDRSSLATLMDGIAHDLGFRYYALIHHDDLRQDPKHRVKLLNYPVAIEKRIIGQATWRRDPVIRGCIFAERAFHWSELPNIIRLDRRDQECLIAGVRSGLGEGITVPYVLLGECTGSCTFAFGRPAARPGHSAWPRWSAYSHSRRHGGF